MKLHRTLSIILVLAFVAGTFAPSIPAQAQGPSLFEGMIAYVGNDGNVYLLRENGETSQLTSDANITTEWGYSVNTFYYDCVSFSPNGSYLAFEGVRGEDLNYRKLYVYDLVQGHLAGEFENVGCMESVYGDSPLVIHTGWLQGPDPFYVSETEYLDSSYQRERTKAYAYKLNGEKYPIFDVTAYGWVFVERDGINTISYYETSDQNQITVLNWVTNEKTYIERPYKEMDANLPGYNIVDISETKYVLTNEDGDSLYLADKSNLVPQLIYSVGDGKSVYGAYNIVEFVKDKYLFFIETSGANEDRENDFLLLNTESLGTATLVDRNVEYPWWFSIDVSRIYYVRFVEWEESGHGTGINQRELIVYDLQTGEKRKIIDVIPNVFSADVESALRLMIGPIDWYYGSTSTETSAPGTIPLVTAPPVTTPPDASITPPSSDVQYQNYDEIFRLKETAIEYLKNPPLDVLEYDRRLIFDYRDSPNWGYDEAAVEDIFSELENTYSAYQRGQLSPTARQAFETQMAAFTRLTYTEVGLQGLLPPAMQLSYDVSKYWTETVTIGLKLIFSITRIADWLEEIFPPFASPIRKLEKKITYWLLTLLEKTLKDSFDSRDPLQREFRDEFQEVMWVIKSHVDSGKTLSEVLKEAGLQRLLAEYVMVTLMDGTQDVIDVSARSIFPERSPGLPYLEVKGTDEDAYAAIQTIVTSETIRAQQSHQRTEAIGVLADASDVAEIVDDTISLDPSQFSSGLSDKISKWTTGLQFFSQWLNAYSTLDSMWNMLYMGDRMLRAPRIAFDPSELNNLRPFQNMPGSQTASLNILPPGKEQIPAHVFYSVFQQQANDSMSLHQQRVREVLTALETGTDAELIAAIDNLVLADDDVAFVVSVSENPLLGLPAANEQVTSFLTASTTFSSANANFQIALLLSLANRTDPGVRQQVGEAAQNLLVASDEFNAQYSALTQPGFDLSVSPASFIARYALPESIKDGEPFVLKLHVFNMGTTSFSGGIIVVDGGESVSETTQLIGEVQPGQEIVVDITLHPLKAGDQVLALDLIQNEAVVDSRFVPIEINQSDNPIMALLPFAVPSTTLWIASGLGVLCLGVLAIGGVFFAARSRPSSQSSRKPTRAPQPEGLSSSAQEIKQAIGLAKSKRNQEAFEILRRIVQAEPNNASAWFNLGGVLADMGNYRDSERCYSRARQLGHPKAAEALNWLKQKRM